MARLEGSMPVTFNGKLIGHAYLLTYSAEGIVADIFLDKTDILEDITRLVKLDQLPSMSFSFVIEPDQALDIEEPPEPDCGG